MGSGYKYCPEPKLTSSDSHLYLHTGSHISINIDLCGQHSSAITLSPGDLGGGLGGGGGRYSGEDGGDGGDGGGGTGGGGDGEAAHVGDQPSDV